MFKLIRSAVLYAALALGANALAPAPLLAVTPEPAGTLPGAAITRAEGLREGDMKKLTFLTAPREVPDLPFLDAEGAAHRLAEYRGKVVVLNFWATWCAPCRSEMPTLDKLQAEMGGDDLAVVPIATIRNTVPAVQRFFASDKIAHLPILLDPNAQLARHMGVLGLPVTLILDPGGREIARLIGEADWSSPSAKAVLGALIEGAKD